MSKEELSEIKGGFSWWAVGGILGAALTFIMGFVEGITNPVKCGK